MIKVVTYNCQGLKNSLQDISELCQQYDFIFLQETWLFNYELHILSTISHDFERFGISSIDTSMGIVRGRPYGGMAILVRKQYRSLIEFQQYEHPRILGLTVKFESEFFLSSVCICHINVSITKSCTWNILVRSLLS